MDSGDKWQRLKKKGPWNLGERNQRYVPENLEVAGVLVCVCVCVCVCVWVWERESASARALASTSASAREPAGSPCVNHFYLFSKCEDFREVSGDDFNRPFIISFSGISFQRCGLNWLVSTRVRGSSDFASGHEFSLGFIASVWFCCFSELGVETQLRLGCYL